METLQQEIARLKSWIKRNNETLVKLELKYDPPRYDPKDDEFHEELCNETHMFQKHLEELEDKALKESIAILEKMPTIG